MAAGDSPGAHDALVAAAQAMHVAPQALEQTSAGRACWSPTTTPTCGLHRAVAGAAMQWNRRATARGAGARAREPPELVLTDVMMPGLDGFGLLRALRADARTRDIPVIMLSARAGEEAASRGCEPAPTTIWSSRSRRASWWRA